ncbi:MAG: hypothetical protein OXH24_08730 [Cyanobacteria bacterium MAG IRC3_bin_20]|nr:hypothetical protein [Cyanobacteria bacterium MAG IRC3_bin_20]
MSGSIYVHVTAGALVDTQPPYGPHKTLYNRFRRWWDQGVFPLTFSELARSDDTETEVLLMGATDLNVHPHPRGNEQQAPCGL